MTRKTLNTTVDGLLNDIALANGFEYDPANKNSVGIAIHMLMIGLESARELIIEGGTAATKIRVPAATPAKAKVEAKLPPTVLRVQEEAAA